MQYRHLGKSGLKVSVLSFGSWVTFHNQVDQGLAVKLMSMAYEAGINFFDNAEVYAGGESERMMGEALKKLQWPHDTFCVSSKVFWGGERATQNGLSFKHVREACDAALKRLQVDYLDLYFCHRPDPETPIEETVRAMHTLIMQGKILYWGTSEWEASQIQAAHEVASKYRLTPPSMEQAQYNMFHRDRVEIEYGELYTKYGMGMTTWSPLASGILSGKYTQGIPADSRVNLKGYEWMRTRLESQEGKEKIQKAEGLKSIASGLGISLPQLAISWCLQNEHVSTVILGARKEEQLADNLKAIEALPLWNDGLLDRCEEILS